MNSKQTKKSFIGKTIKSLDTSEIRCTIDESKTLAEKLDSCNNELVSALTKLEKSGINLKIKRIWNKLDVYPVISTLEELEYELEELEEEHNPDLRLSPTSLHKLTKKGKKNHASV